MSKSNIRVMVMKFIAVSGLVMAIGLALIDWETSRSGIQAILPQNSQSMIVTSIPIIVATLAIAFNATSTLLMRMLQIDCDEGGYAPFSKMMLVGAWIGFVTFDAFSSFVGLLSAVSGMPLGTIEAITNALRALDPAQVILVVAVSALAAFSPLLITVFADMLSALDNTEPLRA